MIYILPTDTCYWVACALEDKSSYEKIYKMKKRDFAKPLALMVKDFQWLRDNTDLTDEQVDFVERYEKPFTVLTNSTPVELFLRFWDDSEEHLINKDIYERVAFRVASNSIEEDLIATLGPIWLTSANLAWAWETYSIEKIEEDFSYYIDKWTVEILGTYDLDPNIPASDIFEFDGESLEIEYLRKN